MMQADLARKVGRDIARKTDDLIASSLKLALGYLPRNEEIKASGLVSVFADGRRVVSFSGKEIVELGPMQFERTQTADGTTLRVTQAYRIPQ